MRISNKLVLGVCLVVVVTMAGCATEPAHPTVSTTTTAAVTPPPAPAKPKSTLFSLDDLKDGQFTPKGTKPKRRIANLQPSLDVLVQEILKGTQAKDSKTLKKLVINREEFCAELWPEFPASKTPNVTCDWAWDHDEIRSNIKRDAVLANYGGKKMSFVKIEFKEKPIVYDTFRVLMQPRVTLKDEQGKLVEVKDLFGPVLECEGRFKLYSYYNGD